MTEIESKDTVSVIVTGRNRRKELLLCIQSIMNSTSRPSEIIYVDTGSVFDLCREVHDNFPSVITLQTRTGNPQVGRNIGAQKSTGQWLLFCDDDVLIARNVITQLLLASEAYADAGIIGCKIQRPKNGKNKLSSYSMMSPVWLPREGHCGDCEGTIRVFAVRNLYFIRRELFYRAGGWDQLLFIQGDEVDLCYRVYRLGFQVLCLGETYVYDLNDNRNTEIILIPEVGLSRRSLGVRNIFLTMFKNLSIGALMVFVPIALVWFAFESMRIGSIGLTTYASAMRDMFLKLPQAIGMRKQVPSPSIKVDIGIFLKLQFEKVIHSKIF